MKRLDWVMFITVAAAGCGPIDQPEAASTTDAPPPEGSSSTGSDPGQTASSDPTGGDTTGGDPTTDGGDPTDGGDTTTDGGDPTEGEPASVCDPQPADVGPFAVELDPNPEEPYLDQTIDLDVSCTVTSITTMSVTVSLELACDDAAHVLDVSGFDSIALAAGDVVTLRAFDTQPWWRETFVLLQREGQVIVAGMESSTLPSGDGNDYSPPGTFFDPLGLDVLTDVCRPEPLPEDDGEPCNFVCPELCYQVQRRAIEVASGGQSVVVYDGNVGTVDGLQVGVGAEGWLNVQCSDTPNGWYRLVIMRTR